jgi:hypothetical protein
MPQADFVYRPANDAAGLPLTVSIFAARAHGRDEIRDDVTAAGLEVRECGSVAALLEACPERPPEAGGRRDEPRPLGEVVLLDCPQVGAADLAALSRLDMRAARSGAHLVISTTVEALDDVFACCDQSAPQILVDPSRAERVIALGRVLARVPNLRLRELAEDERLTLLRLTEQVGEIAARLERLGGDEASRWNAATFRFASPAPGYAGQSEDTAEQRLIRMPRSPLPDPRLVRTIIRQRRLRTKFFGGQLFADPAWDILLDLTAARAEHTRVSVTSLCIASGVPPTTALRWIGQMTQAGLLERVEDDSDRRRAFIALSDGAADGMARYFVELGRDARVI